MQRRIIDSAEKWKSNGLYTFEKPGLYEVVIQVHPIKCPMNFPVYTETDHNSILSQRDRRLGRFSVYRESEGCGTMFLQDLQPIF
jgi:hypothetical protein